METAVAGVKSVVPPRALTAGQRALVALSLLGLAGCIAAPGAAVVALLLLLLTQGACATLLAPLEKLDAWADPKLWNIALAYLGVAAFARGIYFILERKRPDVMARAGGGTAFAWASRPWLSSGVLLLLLDGSFLLGTALGLSRDVLATSILASFGYLFFSCLWLVLWLLRGAFAWLWRIANHSAFGGGAVSAGGLLVVAGLAFGWSPFGPTLSAYAGEAINRGAAITPSAVGRLPTLSTSPSTLAWLAGGDGPGGPGEGAGGDGLDSCLLTVLTSTRCQSHRRAAWSVIAQRGAAGGDADGQDILQDAALATCTAKPEPTDPCKTFVAAVQNRITDRWRTGAGRARCLIQFPPPSCPAQLPDDAVLMRERAELVQTLICQLPASDQVVLTAWLGDPDQGFARLGEQLGVSSDAARMQFNRASKRLRSKIIEQCPELAP